MYKAHTAAIVLLIATLAFLIGGCGGGGGGNGVGGGGNASTPVVVGKVVDMNGNPVPGATVSVQDGGPQTTTLSQGAFRLVGVGTGVQRIMANVSQNGTNNTGSTQALVIDGATVSNATIQVSPSNQQATVAGNVHDANGNPLRDARIFLSVFATPNSSASAGSVASLVAFADNNGNYRLQNIPAPVTQYTVAASLQGYQNTTVTVQNLSVGETRSQDFTLGRSVGQSVLTPTNVAVFSYTQPSQGQRPYAVAQASGAASPTAAVYENIRRILSPAYAQRVEKAHAAARTQKLRAQAMSQFGPYAIEMDIFFDNAEPDSLAGFRVYSSAGNNSLTPYDFLQDPLANVYTDLDPFYTPNQQYNFAVSAINTDGSETSQSQTTSVQPLDGLTLTQPAANSTLGNPVIVAWNGVNGATDYTVFLYTNGFPSVNATFQQFDAGGTTSYTLPVLPSGDYYVVVAGADGTGSAVTAVTVTPIIKFHVR